MVNKKSDPHDRMRVAPQQTSQKGGLLCRRNQR